MRSATSNTCGMLWLIRITGRPLSRIRWIRSSTWPDSFTPSAAVGSSMMTTRCRRTPPRARPRQPGAGRRTASPPPASWTEVPIPRSARCTRWSRRASPSCRAARKTDPERARPAYLAAEEQVRRRCQGGRHGEVLVDGLDARAAGVRRALELDRPAVEEDLALVRHEGAGEALISVDLPAPLSPIDGEDLARQSSKSAPSSAVTWPKRLTRPGDRNGSRQCSGLAWVGRRSGCHAASSVRTAGRRRRRG